MELDELVETFEFLGEGLRQLDAEIAGGKLLQAIRKSGGRLCHGFGADALDFALRLLFEKLVEGHD